MCLHVSFQDNKCHMIWIISSLKPLPMYVYTVYYFDLDFWSFNWATNQYIFSMSRPIVLSLTLTLEQSHYQKPGSSQKYMHCNVDNHMPLSYLQCRMLLIADLVWNWFSWIFLTSLIAYEKGWKSHTMIFVSLKACIFIYCLSLL